MDKRRCLKIAESMHPLLVAEIGQGVDTRRMIGDALYARDVLLVCDALRGSELARLAQLYRKAAQAQPVHEAGPESAPASSGGLGAFINSIFVSSQPPASDFVPAAAQRPRVRGWLQRALGRAA